jgi:pimeloyl-ACP methyl ester carboxylesterase
MESVSLTRCTTAAVILLAAARPVAASPAAPSGCSRAAFLTYEHGKLAAVDWVDRTANRLHTRVVETQSHVVDATIELRADETAAHSSAILSTMGDEQEPMKAARDLGEGAIYWSPRIPSSIEQAVARARILDQPLSRIPGASLYSASRSEITVERLDPTDWLVGYQDKKYLVLTDEHGCMLSATMPDYGVVIERRTGFAESNYPPWPPYSAPPDHAYGAQEVSIRAPQGHLLAGTFTVPSHDGRIAAAILITGLSPHERNNGDAPWMTFRDIADSLGRAGIAALRVDDRGIGRSTGDNARLTIFDKADDVRSEVAWLRAQPGIDPKRIMLIGYSEGGLIAPMVAAKDPAIAAIVALAGPGVPGMSVARYQVEQPILKDPKLSDADRAREIAKRFEEALRDLSPHESSFLAIDPITYDRQVRCPALIIQGGADATVPVRSAERIAWAMRAGGNADVTVRIVSGVSHSLLPDPVGLSSAWGALPAFLTSPEVLDALTRWSVARLKPTATAVAPDQTAETVVRAAIAAQGGEQALRALRHVEFDAVGYRNMVEQSERPEGPYLTEFDRTLELHDLALSRFRRTLEFTVPPFPETRDTIVLANGVGMRLSGENKSAANSTLVQQMQESLALSPERVLLTALDARNLHLEPDTMLHGIAHRVLVFDLNDAPVKVYLNSNAMLPTAVDTSGTMAHSGYFSYLGDVTMRTWYSSWSLQKGGIHYPMQWNIERNGLPDRMLVISKLAFDGTFDEAGLVIPEEVRAQAPARARSGDLESLPLGLPNRPAVEIVPGVVLIPGNWNVTLVKQRDGIVVIEAPISSGYSAKVIEEAGRRFPSVPIKAVVTTSDSWPHLAGIREYVARGIPVYGLDLNREILERVIGDRRTSKPDALSRAPKEAVFHFVSSKSTLGAGSNRLELYPLRGITSERQMMVDFPEHRLLYGSDAFQKISGSEYFTPQTVGEVIGAVEREHLAVDRFFMMHVDPTRWSQLR